MLFQSAVKSGRTERLDYAVEFDYELRCQSSGFHGLFLSKQNVALTPISRIVSQQLNKDFGSVVESKLDTNMDE